MNQLPHPLYGPTITLGKVKAAKEVYINRLSDKTEVKTMIDKIVGHPNNKYTFTIDKVSRIATSTTGGIPVYELVLNEKDWTEIAYTLNALIRLRMPTDKLLKISILRNPSNILVRAHW